MLVPYANTDQDGYITAVCGFDTRRYYKYFDVTYDLPNGYAPSYGRSRVEEIPHPGPSHGTGGKREAAAATGTGTLQVATRAKSAVPFGRWMGYDGVRSIFANACIVG